MFDVSNIVLPLHLQTTSKYIKTNQNNTNMENQTKPVSIRMDEDGKPVGIRIQTLDEDFTIALRDACDHDLTADEARALGQAPTKKQANIICAYLDEIQAALEEADGDRLDGWYVTCADYPAYNSWYFGSYNGCVNLSIRYYTLFRSRPVLA